MRYGVFGDLPFARNQSENRMLVARLKQLRNELSKKPRDIGGSIFLGNLNDVYSAAMIFEMERDFANANNLHIAGDGDNNFLARALEEAQDLVNRYRNLQARIQRLQKLTEPVKEDRDQLAYDEREAAAYARKVQLIKQLQPFFTDLAGGGEAKRWEMLGGKFKALVTRAPAIFSRVCPEAMNNFPKLLRNKTNTAKLYEMMSKIGHNVLILGGDNNPFYCQISEHNYDFKTLDLKAMGKDDTLIKMFFVDDDKVNVIVPGSLKNGFYAVLDTNEGGKLSIPQVSFCYLPDKSGDGEAYI
ncbi:MAG: hypothetical protein KQJ78_14495 [Deltaproteobacteria bacterium]|nr:hypothetical protein [Deltaproteobacteria bacterium]